MSMEEEIKEWMDEGKTVWFIGNKNADLLEEWEDAGILSEERLEVMLLCCLTHQKCKGKPKAPGRRKHIPDNKYRTQKEGRFQVAAAVMLFVIYVGLLFHILWKNRHNEEAVFMIVAGTGVLAGVVLFGFAATYCCQKAASSGTSHRSQKSSMSAAKSNSFLSPAPSHYFAAVAVAMVYLFLLIFIIRKGNIIRKNGIKKWLLCVFCSILAYLPGFPPYTGEGWALLSHRKGTIPHIASRNAS